MIEASQGNQLVQELRDQILSHAQGMWRYRWRALILMWVLSVVGWVAVFMMPPVYQASARIHVDTENAIRPLLQGIASTSDVMSEVTVVTREMLSRPNLAAVARDTDLDLRAETDQDFEALLAKLQKKITVVGSRDNARRQDRDNIYTISFADPDRQKAIEVVDSLVNTFVEKSLNADRDESSKAQSFLRQQIDEYEARLTEAEDRLADFRRRNMQFMPDQTGDYFARLQSETTKLQEIQSALGTARERRRELLRQIEGEEPVFGIMGQPQQDSVSAGKNAAKIQELETQLESLRLQYTDKHPRIGQILDTIALLKAQDAEATAANPPVSSGTSVGPETSLERNPVYQNMRIQLTNVELEIASLESEARQQQREVTRLEGLVSKVPQVEAELGRLNRDYDVIQRKYEELLSQLETANIGEDIDESIEEVQFRLIDPPYAELNPSGPQRHLLLGVTVLASLGAGLAIAFLFNQLHPAFFTGREISTAFGLPVLGVISYLQTPAEIRRRRRSTVQFGTVLGVFAGSFVVVAVFAEDLSALLRGLFGTVA